jgi:hypothetical protein
VQLVVPLNFSLEKRRAVTCETAAPHRRGCSWSCRSRLLGCLFRWLKLYAMDVATIIWCVNKPGQHKVVSSLLERNADANVASKAGNHRIICHFVAFIDSYDCDHANIHATVNIHTFIQLRAFIHACNCEHSLSLQFRNAPFCLFFFFFFLRSPYFLLVRLTLYLVLAVLFSQCTGSRQCHSDTQHDFIPCPCRKFEDLKEIEIARIGPLVCWSVDLLVCWSVALLVCWSHGLLVCLSVGLFVCLSVGLMVVSGACFVCV